MSAPSQPTEVEAPRLGGEVAELFQGLSQACSKDALVRRHEPLAKRTTLRVGGPADVYFEPATIADLGHALRLCNETPVRWMVMGRGSNLLVRDGGIRGLVICLTRGEFVSIQTSGPVLTAGAGARLKHIAVEARRGGIAGLEFLEGIPGSVGGALRMNAGAMGSATFDCVESVRAMDRQGIDTIHAASTLEAGYRHCGFFEQHIALSAVFRGSSASVEEIEARMRTLSNKRWESQPAAPSAGCIFKNPGSISAGRLIQELGLKGVCVGGAQISEVHGNFFINQGTAKARDVLSLIGLVREKAMQERQIQLETEVQIVGEEEPECA